MLQEIVNSQLKKILKTKDALKTETVSNWPIFLSLYVIRDQTKGEVNNENVNKR